MLVGHALLVGKGPILVKFSMLKVQTLNVWVFVMDIAKGVEA